MTQFLKTQMPVFMSEACPGNHEPGDDNEGYEILEPTEEKKTEKKQTIHETQLERTETKKIPSRTMWLWA